MVATHRRPVDLQLGVQVLQALERAAQNAGNLILFKLK